MENYLRIFMDKDSITPFLISFFLALPMGIIVGILAKKKNSMGTMSFILWANNILLGGILIGISMDAAYSKMLRLANTLNVYDDISPQLIWACIYIIPILFFLISIAIGVGIANLLIKRQKKKEAEYDNIPIGYRIKIEPEKPAPNHISDNNKSTTEKNCGSTSASATTSTTSSETDRK